MGESWFDEKTGLLRFDEIVAARPSFQKIMQDGVVTSAEFREQAETVHKLMEQLEGMLSPEEKALTTETLAELSVLLVLSSRLSAGAQEG